MANEKISQLTNGNPALATDVIPTSRVDVNGVNVSVTAQSIANLASGGGGGGGSVGSKLSILANVSGSVTVTTSDIPIFTVPETGLYQVNFYATSDPIYPLTLFSLTLTFTDAFGNVVPYVIGDPTSTSLVDGPFNFNIAAGNTLTATITYGANAGTVHYQVTVTQVG